MQLEILLSQIEAIKGCLDIINFNHSRRGEIEDLLINLILQLKESR